MRVLILSGLMMLAAGLAGAMFRPAVVRSQSELTVEQVHKSINDAVNYLKKQQRPDGTWPEQAAYAGGLTPLCTLALLNAGVPADDPAVAKALAHLREMTPNATYTTSFQTLALCAAGPKKFLPLIERNVKFLEGRQIRDGKNAGMWAIAVNRTPDHTDNSMTHVAMLALYEAERSGVHVNPKTWQMALDYWKRSQNGDGSWGWGPSYPGTGSMTCAGIACVTIAEGQLGSGDAAVDGDTVNCCETQKPAVHIDRALGWLERNFSVTRNPGMAFWLSYYLYALERAGRMTARRFIGDHDWYREGTHMLVKAQQLSGAWPSDMDNAEYIGDTNVSTAFSLMFMAKGRRPVVIGQLQHAPADDWNRHRNAIFNLVSYVERGWQRDLTYQVLDLSPATVEDLLESPILYLSGRDALNFSDEDKRKLRMYVDRGGFLLAVQCCEGGEFDASFRKLITEIFPEPDAQLRLLAPDHPIWYTEERVAPEQQRQLWGIDVGCRTSVVYCPQDLSCYWELARPGRDAKFSKTVQAQIDAARAIGMNIVSYATNREVKYKDPGYIEPIVAGPQDKITRGTLQVANILHPGGCDAAPAALGNLLRLAGEKLSMRASVEPLGVKLTDPALFKYHLVMMHGRKTFQLTPVERKQWKLYLERGGMVFADAICSSKEFSDSFRKEVEVLFPGQKLQPIAANDPLFSDQFGGETLTNVSRRTPGKPTPGKPLEAVVRKGEPYLEGLKIGERYAVVFSPYDISCALESRDTLQCEGYLREDAARLALNVLLYSMHQ